MKNRHKRSVTIKGQTNKSAMHSHAQRSRRALKSVSHQETFNPFTSNTQNWYQLKKRAQQRINTLYPGARIISNMYHGHHVRHLIQGPCEHIYRTSLREIARFREQSCPFCFYPIDMDHYGSVSAIQEHVHCLSLGNIEFLHDNELGAVTDLYEMACLIHRCRLNITFSEFLSDPLGACSFCGFEKG
jgi:hypothetical protein